MLRSCSKRLFQVIQEFRGCSEPTQLPCVAPRIELAEFYKKFGFALFGAAFSHSADTEISLSQLVNGTEAQNAVTFVGGGSVDRRFHIYDNVWFRKLSDMGYRIRVYQSDYIDFCEAKDADVDYCFTYPAK